MDAFVLNTGIVYVPKKHVAFLWPMVEPMVNLAVEECNGELDSGHIRDALLDGRMQLFLAYDDELGVIGAVVTEVVNYPLIKVLRCITLGGREFGRWVRPMQEKLQRYRDFTGCAHIESVVRPGLARVLKPFGWRPSQYLMIHRREDDGKV